MTTIKIECTHRTAWLPKLEGEGITVDFIKGGVCPDAVITEIPHTVVRSMDGGSFIAMLFISDETDEWGEYEYTLTVNGEIKDAKHFPDNTNETTTTLWKNVLFQLVSNAIKATM